MHAAKRSVLDTLGCALHGSTLPWGGSPREVTLAEGGVQAVPVWGTRARGVTDAGGAAERDRRPLVRAGRRAHGRDDPHRLAHRSDRARDRRSREGSTAEPCSLRSWPASRSGRASGWPSARSTSAPGFHPQGTVGVFAAAAAAGRAARLDAATVHEAFGIAGSQAAGLMAAQEGAMVKRLHSGRASQSGVFSALLAERGFTGIEDVLEADFGGFASTMGGGEPDLGLLTDELGERWETEQIGFKIYASCAAAQTSLEVVAGCAPTMTSRRTTSR